MWFMCCLCSEKSRSLMTLHGFVRSKSQICSFPKQMLRTRKKKKYQSFVLTPLFTQGIWSLRLVQCHPFTFSQSNNNIWPLIGSKAYCFREGTHLGSFTHHGIAVSTAPLDWKLRIFVQKCLNSNWKQTKTTQTGEENQCDKIVRWKF